MEWSVPLVERSAWRSLVAWVLGESKSWKNCIQNDENCYAVFPSLAIGWVVLARRNEHTSGDEIKGRGMEPAKFGHDLVRANSKFSKILLMKRNGILTKQSITINKHDQIFSG